MILLAQINTPNPDPNIAWNVILTIGVIITIAAQFIILARSNRAQKREVSFEFEPASKKEFDKHVEENERDHRDLFSKLGGVERGGAAKLSGEITAVHNRVNGLEKSIGGLEKSAEITNQRLAQVDSKVDRLIERKS